MIPSKKIEELILKHKNLEGELSSGNIDKKLFAAKSKEYSDLNEIIDQAKKYLNFDKNKKDLEEALHDSPGESSYIMRLPACFHNKPKKGTLIDLLIKRYHGQRIELRYSEKYTSGLAVKDLSNFLKEIFLIFLYPCMNKMLNNDLLLHLYQIFLFLDNSFLYFLVYHNELQNEHQVYLFPFQKL